MSKHHTKKRIILLALIYCSCQPVLSYGNSSNPGIQVKLIQNNDEFRANNHSLPVRDPFFPLASTSCMTKAEHFRQWALGGIISNQRNRYGWVVSPDGIWQKVQEGEHLAGNWQIVHIGSQRIELLQVNPTGSCRGFIQPML